ncbi:phage holin family protein [Neobacillus sedimentimangrovi]|uniref:Phage holin family protein n=1 Tax=Neobacillus sedimentimangrovi TaxID=2699460 RepID=A0ABS8QKZ6_9BACI|nr:phage holin family protein [Neobacillus sedimentimangrovi]MCD4839757.1 phage holin family protein [Neobacillus sedimentimangrovi]
MEAIFKTILAIGGTAISFLFGAWHVSLTILMVFMIIDVITGIMKGAYQGKLKSAVGYKGILKKGGIFMVIILGNMLDVLVGNGMPVFRTMAAFFFIGNEGISILENLGQMGVKVPSGIANKLEQLSKQEEIQDQSKSNNEQ